MADDLHIRYQHARETWRADYETCEPCRSEQHCSTGAPLYQRFADLQDAYLRGLRSR
ncbi:hypothetical protein OOK13_43485 [Streptomyces sp. NBC_00378]|uniref:hypothetical protein n=1 Tax=unclassified Streptomyces TaxID=2593676 RepID=UPI00224FEA5C|nr:MULTISPECIES: hypothetical protein [unclassified Streptomyces]MCX5115193.1 hypothetical protein [Streptomyces sp. NBC_00378]